MGKVLKLVLGLTIGIPVLLVGVSAATVYGLFYDGSSSPISKNEAFNSQDMVKNIIHQSLDNVSSRQALTLGVGEDDLNQLLLIAADNMNEAAKKYVGAPYVKIDASKHTFDIYLHLQVPIFKTKVKLSTTIEFKRMGNDINHPEGIYFKINEIELGRTPVGSFALNVAKNFINDQSIEQIFKDAGFNIKCSLQDKALFYSANDLMNDVISKNPDLDPFYASMLDMAIEKGFLEMSYDKKLFGVDIKLNKLTSNILVDDNRSLLLTRDEQILGYVNNCETLLNNNVIQEDKIETVLNYLCDGYNNTSQENKAYIDTLDLSSINIVNKSEHKGLANEITEDLSTIFKSKLPSAEEIIPTLQNQEFNVSFNEDDLNKTLISSKIIGQCIPFSFKASDAWHVNAIFVDDFYVNILDNALNFIISVNIAGLSTKIVVPLKLDSQDGNKLIFNIQDIYYGQVKANNKMTSSCVEYISDAISNLGKWFSKPNPNENKIVLDLSDCLGQVENEMFKEKLSNAEIISTISGVEPEDLGALNLKFKYSYSI